MVSYLSHKPITPMQSLTELSFQEILDSATWQLKVTTTAPGFPTGSINTTLSYNLALFLPESPDYLFQK